MKRFNIALILSAAIIIGFSVGYFSGSKPEKRSIDLRRFTTEYVTLVGAYEAECYADSTVYKGMTSLLVENGTLKVTVKPMAWTHREPTLFGFGEYLGKELKKH